MTRPSITGPSGKIYYPTVGLEIHAELKTKSKMFCHCKNNPDEKTPNTNVCPICMGHPGTLPVINMQAVKHVLKIGNAIGAKIADFTEWDRKNYFYPDIPKGYQISQYAYPLITGGEIGGVKLTRIHLEEDTAKSSHETGDYSLVDFNRAGLPLMELVTEPVIHDAKTAGNFAKELQLLLRYIGAGEANMEKGEMRVEANISISDDLNKFGTKVEVKNLNSFRSVEKSIEYEINRHMDLLERGEKIIQETRGFDESTGKTFSQRVKEDSHDYRYFPDPDLPKMFISEIPEFKPEVLMGEMAEQNIELPWVKRDRYKNDYQMKPEDAEMFVQDDTFRNFFEEFVKEIGVSKEAISLGVNYITSDIAGLCKKSGVEIKIGAKHFAELIKMIVDGELTSRSAKDILAKYWEGNSATPEELSNGPKIYAGAHGLIQKDDPEALKAIIKPIIEANQKVVDEYKAGKEASLQFLLGQVMKAGKGAVNPAKAKEEILNLIK